MAQMTGGEAVVATLRALGIDAVFGIPSVHNLPIVDALGREADPRFWVVRHEQGAGHMADGYARATGRLAVALTSTGPGAANSVGALWEAYHANSPVLEITGQIATRWLDKGKGALHEVDRQPEFLGAVTKQVYRAGSVGEIPELVVEAAARAQSGRPGPTAVEVPIDLQYEQGAVEIPEPKPVRRRAPRAADVAEAVGLMGGARRIVIWAGGGAVRSGAGPALIRLAETLGAPVVTSTNGRGAVDEGHPLVIGAFTKSPAVRSYLESADLWIAVGTRLRYDATAEWTITAPNALIHVNIDPTERDRNYRAAVYLAADATAAVEALLAAYPGPLRPASPEVLRLASDTREAAFEHLGPWREVAEAIGAALGDTGILTCDATIAAYAFGNRVIPVRHRFGFLYPTTSAIGPGLPLALGAQVGRPDRRVIAICGDGGFLLDVGDLAMAAQYRLPVVFCVFNDHAYGILKRAQMREFGRLHGVELNAPDFMQLASAFGLKGLHAATPAEFRERLAEGLALREPVLLEVDVAAIGPIPLSG